MNLADRVRDRILDGIFAILVLDGHHLDQGNLLHNPIRERYLMAMSNIRNRIENASNDNQMDQFSIAYFNIMNHGRHFGVIPYRLCNNLVVELASSQVKYLEKRSH